MSTKWSPIALFGIDAVLDHGKWIVPCQIWKANGKPCGNQVPPAHIDEMRRLCIAIADRPIDQVSERPIECLAQASVCEDHHESSTGLAEKWKKMVTEKIKAEWRRSRAHIHHLQRERKTMSETAEITEERLELAEGNAKALQVELMVSENKLIATETELKVADIEKQHASEGLIGRLFGS